MTSTCAGDGNAGGGVFKAFSSTFVTVSHCTFVVELLLRSSADGGEGERFAATSPISTLFSSSRKKHACHTCVPNKRLSSLNATRARDNNAIAILLLANICHVFRSARCAEREPSEFCRLLKRLSKLSPAFHYLWPFDRMH